jgi:hypothetical protein
MGGRSDTEAEYNWGMREQFPGYYRPTEAEFQALWDECLFVVDANVLLNLYRTDGNTAEAFIGILKGIRDRLWVPHQAAFEFHENRLGVLHDRATMTMGFEGEVNKARGTLENAIRHLKRHPAIDHDHLLERAGTFFDDMNDYLAEQRAKEPSMFEEEVTGDDPILDKLTDLLDGRVGEPFSADELAAVHAEGAKRFAEQRPPGYKDAEKGEPRQFGDLVLWKQLLAKAAADGCSVVLITDDTKEDWWRIFHGKRVGPRPELVAEFRDVVGQTFYMYDSARFAEEARSFLGEDVSAETVHEIERARQRAPDAEPSALWSGPQVSEIVGITYRQLDYWARTDILRPIGDAGGQLYTYRDLIILRTVKRLLDAGHSLRRARLAADTLRSFMKDSMGQALIVRSDGVWVVDDDALASMMGGSVPCLTVISLRAVAADVDAAIRGDLPPPPVEEPPDAVA